MSRTSLLLLFILIVVQTYCQDEENTTTYNPEEFLSKIFNFNATVTPRQKYGFIKFEDSFGPQNADGKPYQQITFDEQPNPVPSGPSTSFKFEDDQSINSSDDVNDIQQTNNQGIHFQDDNRIDDPKPQKKKRRRRRRKPKYQNGYPGYPNQGYPGQYTHVQQGYPGSYPVNVPQGYPPQDPNVPQYPGYPSNPQGNPGPYPVNPQGVPGQPLGQYPYTYPGGPGQFNRPPRRRPKQSFASEALTAVTEALTSIALYDDYQCVPRLLCEAAGGGALGSSSVLQNIAGLQPLLTLLAAYNGISSSPLFLFGRAVFLGMTAKGNLGTCRYAYPQCPNDPEQLVHYLNNHNGGFFRFFNAPQANNPQGQQNVEQFYNQLSQNYGFYQPGPNQLTNQENYGIYQPNVPNQHENYQSNAFNQQNYGLYQPNIPSQFNNPNLQSYQQGHQGYPYTAGSQNYGLQNYGQSYPYQNNYGYYKSNGKDKNKSKIEKRILNGPIGHVSSDDNFDNNDNPKWLFPESGDENNNYNNYRGGRDLKFPNEDGNQHFDSAISDNNRKGKGFSFPDYQSNIKYVNYNEKPFSTTTPSYSITNYGFYQNKYTIESTTQNVLYQNYNSHIKNSNSNNNNNYYHQNSNNQNSYNQNKYNQNGNDEELETVYVIRGNGDPNHPEIVKLKPGEKLQ